MENFLVLFIPFSGDMKTRVENMLGCLFWGKKESKGERKTNVKILNDIAV